MGISLKKCLLALCWLVVVCAGFPAYAAVDHSAVPWTKWKQMRANSFSVDIKLALSIDDQCGRIVAFDDRITADDCHEAMVRYEVGECKIELVSQGTRLDALTGLLRGKPHVWTNKEVALDHDPLATHCVLANGKEFFFFNGEPGVSCYNLGVKLPKPVVPLPPPEPVTGTENCVWVGEATVTRSSNELYTSGVAFTDACGDTSGFVFGGKTGFSNETVTEGRWRKCRTVETKNPSGEK